MSDELLQALLGTLIQVLVPLLMGFLVALVKMGIDYLKVKVKAEHLAFASNLAREFVLAAEQNGLAGALSNEGAAKKEYVLKRLESELEKRDIKIDVWILSDLVESAVFSSLWSPKPEQLPEETPAP